MFLKNLLQAGTQSAKRNSMKPHQVFRQPAFRKFSTGQVPPSSSGSSAGALFGIAASVGGFMYLAHTIRQMNANKMQYMSQGQTYMSPLVQSRLSKTFGWFSYGLLSTAATCHLLRNSMMWAAVPWWAHLIVTGGFFFGAHAVDYESMMPLKALFFTGFTGMMGLSILPLI